MKHSEYIEIVKNFGNASLKKVILRVVIRKLPFLAAGPMNFLLVKLVSWLAGESVEEAEMRLFFEYVDFKTDGQATGFEDAMIYNHTMQTIGTENEKKNAEDRLDNALLKLWNLRR